MFRGRREAGPPPEAEVFLDGHRLTGSASGSRELDAGEHLLVAELQGYQTQLLHVELAPGESTRATLTLERAPLNLALPAPATNGAPSGHALPANAEALQPELDTRSSKKTQLWAVGLGAGGLALAGTAVGLFVWNTDRYHTWQADRDRFDAMLTSGSSGPSLVTESHALTDRAVNIQRTDDLAIGLALAAGAALTTATVLWFTSRQAHAAAPPLRTVSRRDHRGLR
jgi:hypothetical protein